jgi:hypothetical protein
MRTLVTLLALCAGQQPAAVPPVDWGEVTSRFQADATRLQKSGTPLDLAQLKLENLPPGELENETARRDNASYGESWYEMLRVLGAALGLQVDPVPASFRRSFQRSLGTPPVASYLPERKAIVIDEPRYTPDARFDRALLHALALASLDQQPGGLAALRAGASTDELLCSRGWIEGRAELLARRAGGAGPIAGLSAFEERTGGFAFVDLAGQAEVGRQESLPEAERARPLCGRALLHGGPCEPAPAIALDGFEPAGMRLLREDALGELGLRFVLSMGGAHPVGSIGAATGLRADRLKLWGSGERERALAWRLVCQRESDAVELEQLLAKLARGTRTRRAHVLDWCFATRPEVEAQLAQSLAALALPPAASEAEARAVSELQAARLARQPHLQGERWLLPELDLAWKLPPGWTPSFFKADAIVYLGEASDGFRDNLTFREYALPQDATPEKVLEGTRKGFEGHPSAKLVRAELCQTPAGRGVRVEFTQSNGGRELHQLELQLVQPGKKQTITATLLEKHWKEAGPGIEAWLAATERSAQPAPPGPTK